MRNDPITLGGFIKRDWERIMYALDKSDDPVAKQMKYVIQCKIDVAIDRGDWK